MKKIEIQAGLEVCIKSREMDYEPKTKRDKKSDKAKRNFEKNGGFSQKHIRLAEAVAEAKAKKSPGKKA